MLPPSINQLLSSTVNALKITAKPWNVIGFATSALLQFSSPMKGRGWASDEMESFFVDHNIRHVVAPGEAHMKFGAIKRRNTILRKNIKIYITDRSLTSRDGLRKAMAYVLPQVNSAPTVADYSPSYNIIIYLFFFIKIILFYLYNFNICFLKIKNIYQ